MKIFLALLLAGFLSYDAQAACTGVAVTPNDAWRINAIVSSKPGGTTFCFKSGTYVLTSTIQVKDGSTIQCEVTRTCLMDGKNALGIGVQTPYQARNVSTVSGFVFKRFTSACLHIRPKGLAFNNEAAECRIGLSMDGSAVGNYVHHNTKYGVMGGPAIGILIEANEISYNNTGHYDIGDASATKIVGSTAGATVTWRNNKVHDNYGNGIWNDGNVVSLIEGNEVYNNTHAGIFHEISWDAQINNNTVYGNASLQYGQNKSCWHGAQIALNNSQRVNIFNNTVVGNGTNAICMVYSLRVEGPAYPQGLADVKVYDNVITLIGKVTTGYAGDKTPTGIVFSRNQYRLENLLGTYWQAMGGNNKNKTQWQALGQDAGATFTKN